MTTIDDLAESFAALAIRNIGTEYPHATQHVVRGPGEPSEPSALHPAFHGSYDWHSCVHMHWLLVRLYAEHPEPAAASSTLDSSLAPANIAAEARYLADNPAFERPYGWAWALALVAAAQGTPWAGALEPLADTIDTLSRQWMRRMVAPIRYGVHQNSAFALALLLDAAEALGRTELAAACRSTATDWFAADRDYPASWEPSGHDFLSPALAEADLMRRVLPDFPVWLARFLPDPAAFTPVGVRDDSDGHQSHLYGLNLSRAWHLRTIAAALPSGDSRVPVLRRTADDHLAAGLPAVSGGGFQHEHWLATYAYLALTA
jgi:DUF2891 family protein